LAVKETGGGRSQDRMRRKPICAGRPSDKLLNDLPLAQGVFDLAPTMP
jgi:hypothetical protein